MNDREAGCSSDRFASPEARQASSYAGLESLKGLEALVAATPALFVRYSEGPVNDARSGSIGTESNLELPCLSAKPLNPEPWWTRPVRDWLARQLCQYKHLQEKNPDRYAWVLQGELVGRGPDCEPLIAGVEPAARLSPNLLAEAERRYQEKFKAGLGPEDENGFEDCQLSSLTLGRGPRSMVSPDSLQYILLMTSCFVITLPLELVLGARVYRRPLRLMQTLFVIVLVFCAWDIVAITAGLWTYSEHFTSGIVLPLGLPFEELLFFVVIPVCGILTYEAVGRIFDFFRSQSRGRDVTTSGDD